ncbi:MAG: GIY-YIG nuclease family protein [Pirellulaceae bacterium]
MNRLLDIGFETAGHWLIEEGQLKLELLQHSKQQNVLYAFICDGEILYIGKTTQTLAKRLYGYQRPGRTQATNVKNHLQILDLLAQDRAVEVLVLPDSGLMHYGQFHLNLAAGLEDSLIKMISPPWNGGIKEVAAEASDLEDGVDDEEPAALLPTFLVTLHPTYMRYGFFNVGVDSENLLGQDGETIEFFLGESDDAILGTINRRQNRNNTPRLMGGTGLRDWFQSEFQEMDDLEVCVLSPRSIRLRHTSSLGHLST